MMAEPGDFEIIAGVGNEVFYFFGICRLFSRLKLLLLFLSGGRPLCLGPSGMVVNTSGGFDLAHLVNKMSPFPISGGTCGAVSDLGGAHSSWWSHSASQQC